MADGEELFEKTNRSKAALDAFEAVKKFQELLKSGVDSTTAFLQVFCGIYYLVKPVPRPDYFLTIMDLHRALKDSHAHFSGLAQECKDGVAYLEPLLKENSPNK